MINNQCDLFLIVTCAIIFLFGFLIVIVFIIKFRKDRINIEKRKKEIEVIEKQKIILFKEIHHRVKNNLQLISGFLYLQSVKYKSSEVSAIIDKLQKHINSIALVHEMLYKDDTLSLVSMDKYLGKLGARLLEVSSQEKIVYKFNISNVSLPVDYATTLGLIANELIMNSLKYAFVAQNGTVSISLKETYKKKFLFIYSDNGKGYNIDGKVNENKSLGQRLIKMLAQEIEADLKIKNKKGLTYIFKFKIK